jgi:hydroxyethylthiazole kinase-like uncharacterized protein yjeF
MDVGASLVRGCYPRRPDWSRKHDFGYVVVVGGSREFVGAPVLAALAALRAGADMAFTVTPRNPFWAAVNHPDLVPVNLGTDFLSQMTEDAWLALGKSDAIVIGNGVTRRPEVGGTVAEVLREYRKPVVVDGDALHFLGKMEVRSRDVVVTPHLAEFRELSGQAPRDVGERVRACAGYSEATGFTVLLKGHVDVIAGGGEVARNRTGTPYMTKGGTGDVLAGVCGALLARGTKPFRAACCAAYVNGRAGEIAAKGRGEGTLATDVIDRLPAAIASARRFPF